MVPLNSSERRQSYFIFLLFFVVSISIVVLTIFYGVQIPTRQNEQLKRQVSDLQKEQTFLKVFAVKLSKTKNMLAKINLPGVDPSTESYISANLDTLNFLGIDTISHGKIYSDITASLFALDQALKQLRANGSTSDQVAKLQQELKDTQRDLTQCQVNVAQLEKK